MPTRLRDFISSAEDRYANPAKQFLEQTFQEHPVAMCMITIFVVTSFTPVVVATALAVFTVCLAASLCLLTLIALALCLSVILSTTLVSSATMTLFGAGFLHLRRRRFVSADHPHAPQMAGSQAETAPEARTAPTELFSISPRAPRTLFSPKRGRRLTRLLAAALVCELISHIRLPRAVRYNPIYATLLGPTLFGPRRGHFLQRLLSRPFALVWFLPSLGLKLARVSSRLFSWKTLLVAYLALHFLSPRLRGAGRRTMARAAKRLVDAAGGGMNTLLRSAPVVRVLDLPWKAYTATALDITQTALVALVGFLRAHLEGLEERAAERAATPVQSESAQPAQPESVQPVKPDSAQTQPSQPASPAHSESEDTDATYEMVSPAANISSTGILSGTSAETLRARNVSVGVAGEN